MLSIGAECDRKWMQRREGETSEEWSEIKEVWSVATRGKKWMWSDGVE